MVTAGSGFPFLHGGGLPALYARRRACGRAASVEMEKWNSTVENTEGSGQGVPLKRSKI